MLISDPLIYLLILLSGALVAAFVTGAVGFADGLILNAFWLHIMKPTSAIALIIVSSLLIHAIPLYRLRNTLDYSRLKSFVIFGIIGFPFGMWALISIDPEIFKIFIGCLLLGYGLWMLGRGVSPVVRQRPTLDGVVGFSGGFMGGFSALSGLLPTLWMSRQGVPKNVQRGTFEPYIVALNLVGIVAFYSGGKITAQIGFDLLCVTPILILGSLAGTKIYPHINDAIFRKAILILILLSGLMLLV
jgi:hypothetical protein